MRKYRGDSPGKKLVRLDFWSAVLALDPEAARDASALVLAGHEGGDVATLLGLGLSPKSIVAAERSEQAARLCAARWPGVEVRVEDIAKTARRRVGSWWAALLDSCSPICSSLDEDVAALRQLSIPHIGIGFLMGRDKGNVGFRLRRVSLARLMLPYAFGRAWTYVGAGGSPMAYATFHLDANHARAIWKPRKDWSARSAAAALVRLLRLRESRAHPFELLLNLAA